MLDHPSVRDGVAPAVGSVEAADTRYAFDAIRLRQRWRRTMGRAAPRDLSPRLMARILVWREQLARVGDIDRDTRAKLAAATGGGGARGSAQAKFGKEQVKPGTILIREHAGVLQRVMALEQGFAWNGRTYRSLSEVARAITGTNWNGRRFFGLKKVGRREEARVSPAGDGA